VTSRELLAIAAIDIPLVVALLVAIAPGRLLHHVARAGALVAAATGVALAIVALADPAGAEAHRLLVIDAAAGLLVLTISTVGATSVVVSRAYLAEASRSVAAAGRRARIYYVALFVFWGLLVAVPLAANLGLAWLLVEATTATSAILVGFSGRGRALEAAWKYLILTSLGLGVALLGIVLAVGMLAAGGLDQLTWSGLAHARGDHDTALVAYLLLLAGLAAKIGWAPVHNWLPDAHSEAPPPVSALLSGALLPAVMVVAWRSMDAFSPLIGEAAARSIPIGFGLVSLLVAVPFLWRPLAWKRLLAYSSLEHMGVIALGIGFAGPLALAGVVIHLLGHAVAKSLGFYAATPLLAAHPRAAGHQIRGVGRREPVLGATMGVALAALSGVPPSPLFASEVLIVAGGFEAGHPWAAGLAAALLALGFLGLFHALIETTVGHAGDRVREPLVGRKALVALTAASVAVLAALLVLAPALPDSDLVHRLAGGLT
jgi:hydrogenase-4 component F